MCEEQVFSLDICQIIFCISGPSIVLIAYTGSKGLMVLIKPNPQYIVLSRDWLIPLFLYFSLLLNVKSCTLRFMVFFVFKPKLTFQAIGFQHRGLYIIKHWILVVSVRLMDPSGSCCACLLGDEKSAVVILDPCLVLTKISSKLQRIKVQRLCQEAAFWTSLVAQWLRIRLPMQGTQVQPLVREEPTCRRATKPVDHSYWAWALEPVLHNKRSHCNEKPAHGNKE